VGKTLEGQLPATDLVDQPFAVPAALEAPVPPARRTEVLQ
jgi:hypothetical protein